MFTFSSFGYEGAIVNVEVDLRRGIPSCDIVGLSDASVKEVRERTISAIKNSGFDFPSERVLISLSPADLKKEGGGFDLPLALEILSKKYELNGIEKVFSIGELELSGKIRNVNGINAALSTARSCAIEYAILPKAGNIAIPEGMKVYEAENLKDAFKTLQELNKGNTELFESAEPKDFFNDTEIKFNTEEDEHIEEVIKGFNKKNNKSLYAFTVALSGKHNILNIGAPGCGKTLLMQMSRYLTPHLTMNESQSASRIASLAGLLKPNEPYITEAPIRMPHQTASIEGICGGGASCRPGEISLAHNGILFLDEMAEFRSSVLQMLRVPLEVKHITLSRAGRSTVYPANFTLHGALNPCPCGNYGSKEKICLCSAKSIELYWRKISAPLLDRIEIVNHFEKDEEKILDLDLEKIRSLISTAYTMQRKRGVYNKDLSEIDISNFVLSLMEEDAKEEFEKLEFVSKRKETNFLKVLRTLSDMEGREKISTEDLSKALILTREPFLNEITETA